MSQKEELTPLQKAKIYCIKYGHAKYITNCFGYIYCGRCNDQIGDKLGGVFDDSKCMVIGHKCSTCDLVKETITNEKDLEVIKRLEEKDAYTDYNEILEGIEFE